MVVLLPLWERAARDYERALQIAPDVLHVRNDVTDCRARAAELRAAIEK